MRCRGFEKLADRFIKIPNTIVVVSLLTFNIQSTYPIKQTGKQACVFFSVLDYSRYVLTCIFYLIQHDSLRPIHGKENGMEVGVSVYFCDFPNNC